MEDNLKRDGMPDDEAASPLKKLKVDSDSCNELENSIGLNEKSLDDDDVPSITSNSPLTEKQAGISEYIGTHSGFCAIIKQRYSDFIVNEIDLDGNRIHLTNMNYDGEKDDEDAVKMENSAIKDVLSPEDILAIQALVESKDTTMVHNVKAPEEKELRTKIHLAVKKSYAQLETKTSEDKTGNKVIQVLWRKGKGRDANEWPRSKQAFQYVRFVLYKENKDTMDIIGLIAKNLRLKDSLFQYAGTKDKRAKTCQEITAHRIHPKKLCALNKVLWNIGLGNFRYVKEPLKLGQLSGNHFNIVLRNVQGSQECVDQCLSSFRTKGFINYFGMQRFGTTSIPTHRVGCAILLGNWDEVIDLILKPRNDIPVKDKFQQVWAKTHDAKAALNATPRFCGIERKILEALTKNMKSFNAFEKLPRNTRLLYIHSYQSFIWNRMVSKRLKMLGLQVVVGDLVMTDSTMTEPTLVTQDNVGEFALQDVVLPLPGHAVMYPSNEVADWYRELMKEDGLDIDQMKRPQKDYSLSGAYRPLVVLAKDVSWTHHPYDDYKEPLTLSDFDILKGHNLPSPVQSGKYQAVTLNLSLPTSSYATMALREVMKIDTSSFHQTSLNIT